MQKFFLPLLFICFCQWVSAQDTILLTTGRKIIVSSIDLSDNTIAYRRIDKKDKLKTVEPYRVFSILYKDGTERVIYQPDSLDPLDFKVEDMRNYIKGMQDAQSLYKNNYIKIAGAAIGAGSALLGFYGLVGPPLYATVVGSYSPNVDKKLRIKVSGDAAATLGIKEGTYPNSVTGETSSPFIKKDQKLQLGGKTLKFDQDSNIDSAIATINSRFSCVRVHATNENGKIKLFKTDRPDLINVNEYREGFEKKVRDYKIRNGMIYGLAGLLVGSLTYIVINAAND